MPEAKGIQRQDLILVSACLLGVACRYDAQSRPEALLLDLAAKGRLVPFCPEMAGGLPTPRLPAEIESAHAGLDGNAVLDGRTRVVRSDGADVSAEFVAGAEAAMALAQRLGIRQAILKADSPSCGAGYIHDGHFAGEMAAGDGVTTALLKRAGIAVCNEQALANRNTDPK
jgi:uncharacterized protein YbbK (DUF523 family)